MGSRHALAEEVFFAHTRNIVLIDWDSMFAILLRKGKPSVIGIRNVQALPVI